MSYCYRTGKIVYLKPFQAQRTAAAVARRRRAVRNMHIYKCRYCKHWHVTHL